MRLSHPDCRICEVINWEDSDLRELYRDAHVVAFLPPEPATLGHTIIAPLEHLPTIWDVEADTAAKLGEAMVYLAGAVKRAMSPDGLNIIQSNGEVATQTVMHLHLHVVPRWEGDDFGPVWPVKDTDYSVHQKDSAWQQLNDVVRSDGTGNRDSG